MDKIYTLVIALAISSTICHAQRMMDSFRFGTGAAAPCTACSGLLTDCGFESGTLDDWQTFSNGTATFTTTADAACGTYAFTVTITTHGTNEQLYQVGFSVTAGTTYTLKFSAKSNTGRDFNVSVEQNTPWANWNMNVTDVPLTTYYQTFTYDLTAGGDLSGTSTNSRIRFAFDQHSVDGDIYYIDNITLVAQ